MSQLDLCVSPAAPCGDTGEPDFGGGECELFENPALFFGHGAQALAGSAEGDDIAGIGEVTVDEAGELVWETVEPGDSRALGVVLHL